MSINIKEHYRNDNITSRVYSVAGKLHRLDGPAYEYFYQNGALLYHGWYQNGLLHRLDGPAIEHFDLFGRCVDAEYWLNDKKITKSEHQRQAAILKLTTQVASTGGVSL